MSAPETIGHPSHASENPPRSRLLWSHLEKVRSFRMNQNPSPYLHGKDIARPRRASQLRASQTGSYTLAVEKCGSSGKSVLFPSDSTTVGYVEDFLRHDSGVRWFLVRSSYQRVL